jgi:FkbH-like protein
MKLIDALKLLREEPAPDAPPLEVFLACGFTPLHLETFLAAHLRQRFPGRRVRLHVGLFGDLIGNITAMGATPREAGAIVFEWADLDPRLALRQLGGWGPGVQRDILATVAAQARRLEDALGRIAGAQPIAVCPPTLPPAPVSYHPGWQAGAFTLELEVIAAQLAAQLGQLDGIRLVRRDRLPPPNERLDVRAWLNTGFPYRLPHADALAGLLAMLMFPPMPKKGLITDLDDTLWRGIVGDVGPGAVTWDLDHHAQQHGLYQQMLRALAEAGVLVGVASKNQPEVVAEAFRRDDLFLTRDLIFPLEVHWEPKSSSVRRILQAWNVAADSVLFVDDSPIELAEVQTAFPDMELILFPTHDEQAVYALLEHLRDRFGKETITQEDSLRRESLRRATEVVTGLRQSDPASVDRFLGELEAEITLDFGHDPTDRRAFELINKTNQFNLNGRRYSDGLWREQLDDPASFLVRVSYRDKFGPLGVIAVLAGRTAAEQPPTVASWVMSCRAFSRRIEHQCLQSLFDRFGADTIRFEYQETPRNGPLRDFFAAILDEPPAGTFNLDRARFEDRTPALFHQLLTRD